LDLLDLALDADAGILGQHQRDPGRSWNDFLQELELL
jgi:hypothetical protein